MSPTTTTPGPARRGLRASTLAVLVAVTALVAGACAANAAPEPLTRKDAPPNTAIDPAQPCTREAAAAAAPAAGGRIDARFDRATNTIEVTGGDGTLAAVAGAVRNPGALSETAPGEWSLNADISVMAGATLRIAAPEVRWLKLVTANGRYGTVKAFGGAIDVNGSCITSWDAAQNRADTELTDGRGYLLARDGAQMNIDNAEIRYLGHGEVESYGISWRTEGTGGKITNSMVSHNYFGMYSYEVGGLVISDNEFHDNVLYGIDPHTGSHNLTIENNRVHDNGKHGIILAEDCTDSVIRGNTVYRNAHHGIVLYLRSDRNVIENNDTYANAAQGININESNDNVVRENRAYDNTESGFAVTQTSQKNVVEFNQSRGNGQDGIRVVSEAQDTTVHANTIGENTRYGIYVDVDGEVAISENIIFANRAGMMLKGSNTVPDGDNSVFENHEAAVLNG